jgi:hypothetical protein
MAQPANKFLTKKEIERSRKEIIKIFEKNKGLKPVLKK